LIFPLLKLLPGSRYSIQNIDRHPEERERARAFIRGE
jgi:hypothetical protein